MTTLDPLAIAKAAALLNHIAVVPLSGDEIGRMAILLNQVAGFLTRTIVPEGYMDAHGAEIAIIRQHLPKGPATYVDVGAGPAVSSSNTWAFYQEGWRGLLIEPLPTFWYDLLRLRPGDHVSPLAASNVKGIARLRAADGSSSIRPDWSIAEHAEILVETDTLASILQAYPEVRQACRLCSIDVEGLELEVLEGIDWNSFHPAVFVVEYRKFESDRLGVDLSSEWEPILLTHGYHRVGKTELNYIYAIKP
jgi:FkbM family methyltransferase